MKRMSIFLLILSLATAVAMLLSANRPAHTHPAAAAVQSTSDQILAVMTTVNTQLAANGANYQIEMAEYITAEGSNEVGQTVFFKDRGNKQIGARFVPRDPRRGGRTNIIYAVDQAEGAVDGLTVAQTTAAINNAMTTWNNVNCSEIPIVPQGLIPGLDFGVIEFLLGLGGLPIVLGDIQHTGWVPAGTFPPSVIAITFTFVFIDGAGNPTDIDNNGDADTAFAEILYHDNFTWRINGNIDVETVALHESGHGLGQAHFGELHRTDANGKFHFSPRAVMNAGYTGVQQNLTGTDNGGHCSIWARWPNN